MRAHSRADLGLGGWGWGWGGILGKGGGGGGGGGAVRTLYPFFGDPQTRGQEKKVDSSLVHAKFQNLDYIIIFWHHPFRILNQPLLPYKFA